MSHTVVEKGIQVMAVWQGGGGPLSCIRSVVHQRLIACDLPWCIAAMETTSARGSGRCRLLSSTLRSRPPGPCGRVVVGRLVVSGA